MSLDQGHCPNCGSIVKSQRLLIDSYYGTKTWCTDNWHYVSLLPTARPPSGWDWNGEDDHMLRQMDLAFSKPLDLVMKDNAYLL